MAYSRPITVNQYPLVAEFDETSDYLLGVRDGQFVRVESEAVEGPVGPDWSPASAGTSTPTGDATEYQVYVQGGVTKRVSSPAVAVRDEKLDIRTRGGVADGSTSNDAAIAAAIADVPSAWGGTIRFPSNGAGGYKFSNTITLDGKRINLWGDGPATTYLDYHGSGTAVDVLEPNCRVEGLSIRNQGGTGLKGLVCGKVGATTLGRDIVHNVWISGGFATAGLHVSNRELSQFTQVMVLGQLSGVNTTATGILVDDARSTNPTNPASMQLVFRQCRAIQCTSAGWDVNQLMAGKFDRCQSWSNTGTYQFYLRGSTYSCDIDGLDVESTGDATKHGLSLAGNYNSANVLAFSLDRGIDLNNAAGCHIKPGSRFNTVTNAYYINAGNTNCLVYDGGNLGTVTNATPDEVMFYGRITRTKNMEIRGLAGAGYIDFVNEQSVAPAGATNRARLFSRDNGSGKTQLCVIFATGAVQVLATEP